MCLRWVLRWLSKVGVSEVDVSMVGVSEVGVSEVDVSMVGVSEVGVSEVMCLRWACLR